MVQMSVKSDFLEKSRIQLFPSAFGGCNAHSINAHAEELGKENASSGHISLLQFASITI